MATYLKLLLTDELCEFVLENSGDGTLYPTPGEFVRDLLRERKERQDASRVRDAILDGYQDAMNGRVVEYRGNLSRLLRSPL